REIDSKNLAIGDDPRVEGDLHRLSVTCPPRTHVVIMRGGLVATRIAGNGGLDAFDMLEYRLDAPETAASKNCRLQVAVRRFWHVNHRCRNDRAGFCSSRRKLTQGRGERQQQCPSDQMTCKAREQRHLRKE